VKRSKMVAAFPLSIHVMEEIFLPQLSWEGPLDRTRGFALSVTDPGCSMRRVHPLAYLRHSIGIRSIEKRRLPADAKRVVNDSGKKD